MVLVNAIYFKGEWVKKFLKRRTSKKEFYFNDEKNVEVDMMQMEVKNICWTFFFIEHSLLFTKNRFLYKEIKEFDSKVIEIPYKDSDINMMIILPNKKDGLYALESKLNEIKLRELSKRASISDVILKIPKFKIEFDINMKEPLKKVSYCFLKKIIPIVNYVLSINK